MSSQSAIEWTEATWNPVTGCTKVSPGCAHCYIERTLPFRIAGRVFARVGNAETTDVRLHPDRLEQPLHWRRPRLVFVNSLSDLFHEEIPEPFLDLVFRTMALAQQHTFQVLTKRPERAREYLVSRRHDALPNVWIGVSIENARFTWRADALRDVPAVVRFISAEPLLGSLFANGGPRRPLDLSRIDWLIAGGESGPGHRPLDLDHVRELRDCCAAAGVAFFFKQVGGPTPGSGGRDLDGRTHDEMPTPGTA